MTGYQHNDRHTLPRVCPAADGAGAGGHPGPSTVTVHLPFRVPRAGAAGVRPRLVACWGGRRVTLSAAPSADGELREITPAWLEGVNTGQRGRARAPELRPYLGMWDELVRGGSRFFEARLDAVPAGAAVHYDLVVDPDDGDPDELSWLLYASSPRWSFDDIIATHTPPDLAGEYSWIAYHQEADGLHHVRIDVADIDQHLPALCVAIGEQRWHFADPARVRRPVALIDRDNDHVLVSTPADGPMGPLTITTMDAAAGHHDERIPDVARAHRAPNFVGSANLMLVHFAIQALNDLLESPFTDYQDGPRTYLALTMRDECGVRSSRPLSPENGIGDGYALTLAAHERTRVPHLWTFNAGLLAMLAHDAPEDLAYLRRAVAEGLVDPTVVGFAGHRPTYYQPATNRYVIELGVRMMRNHLGAANQVFFPDSRFYRAETDNGPLHDTGMRYLVLDAETTLLAPGHLRPGSVAPEPGRVHHGRFVDHQYLWQDSDSGRHLLLIQRDLRDGLFGHREDEYHRGKLPLQLRRKMIGFATTSLREGNLLVYGDDADKASGNGWFDGTYPGTDMRFNDMWNASLDWIAAHPWIRVVTSRDLAGSPVPPADGRPPIPCVGAFGLRLAIDPSVDPGGLDTVDAAGQRVHFDAWYDRWKDYRATWLGQTLEEVSHEAEFAILDWPRPYRDHTRLHELAQMSFACSTHELPWNKQPLEHDQANTGPVLEPEDFVVAASLQVRNAHVYLAATGWAQWAATGGTGSYCDSGPVAEILPTLRYAADNPMPHLRGKPLQDSPVHWDHDPLANVILYNPQALAVLDRNGGRVTHLFCLVDGEPLCVSGTFKCYQYETMDGPRKERICDGPVLQNTVFTPNHAYVGTDVRESRAVEGTMWDSRHAVDREWWYPDNFNVYADGEIGGDGGRRAGFGYRPGEAPPQRPDLPALTELLERDRRARQGSGENPVVWHDPAHGSFDKVFTLDGRVLTVAYTGVRPGHLVANEFCVDLWTAMIHGTQLERRVSAEVATVSLGEATVTLTPGLGCVFSDDTMATSGPALLRLHRVLTDRFDVVCPAGGDFSYRIELPG